MNYFQSKGEIMWKTYKDIPYAPITMFSTVGVNKTGSWRTNRPILDQEKCINCNTCWKVCPEPCISLGELYPKIDYDYCKGCGICANECPVDAIVMVPESEIAEEGSTTENAAQEGE